jgi:hypothetical protein
MHPSENTCTDSAMYNRIKQFAELQVGKYFHVSLTEFLEYPRDICIHILEISTQMQKNESTAATNILNDIAANEKR